jgi:hypothetical protein
MVGSGRGKAWAVEGGAEISNTLIMPWSFCWPSLILNLYRDLQSQVTTWTQKVLLPVILGLGRWRSGRWKFKAIPGKIFVRPHLSNSWVWGHTPVIPATQRSTKRMIMTQASLDIRQDPFSKITNTSQVLVAQTYNPSYSGGRDQEDRGSKPAWTSSSQDPISKIPNTKKGWRSGSSGRAPA